MNYHSTIGAEPSADEAADALSVLRRWAEKADPVEVARLDPAIARLLPGREVANYPDLSRASSLCGACLEACPVKIDIPRFLLEARAELRRRELSPASETTVLRMWARLAERPALFRLALAAARWPARMLGARDGDRAWLRSLPGPAAGWTATRDLGVATGESFRAWMSRREASR